MKPFQTTTLLCCLPLLFASSLWAAPQSFSGVLGAVDKEKSEPSSSAKSDEMTALLNQVTENLGVTENQSQGGIASIFNYVKGNLSGADFSALASAIPGLNGLASQLPSSAASKGASASAFSGLMNKAAEYSSSVKSVNDLKQQFEALGLTPDMIGRFVEQINIYLNSQEDEKTQSLFQTGLGKLLNAL